MTKLKGKAKDYNLLFIISDQHRSDAMGCAGNSIVKTPHLDRLAQGGTLFSNAYCQSPLCAPSRGSVMTGMHCHTCNALGQNSSIHNNTPALGEPFRQAGFATASIGKVHVVGESESRDLGFDHRALRYYGWDTYRDYIEAVGLENFNKYNSYHEDYPGTPRDVYNHTNQPTGLDESLMFDNVVVDRSIKFMEKNQKQKFCLWVGIEKPHPELYAPASYHALYDPKKMPTPPDFGKPMVKVPKYLQERQKKFLSTTEAQANGALAAYYANVTFMDTCIGRLMSSLDRLNLTDNTIVIYTSDHGEMMYEHTLNQKHCLFDGAIKVPFIFANKNLFPIGHIQHSPSNLLDLFPTLMDLYGMEHPDGLEGNSLVPSFETKAPTDTEAISEFYGKTGNDPMRMIRSGKWKYVHTHQDMPQLYDLSKDPGELTNLAFEPSLEKVKNALEEKVLRDWEIPEIEKSTVN